MTDKEKKRSNFRLTILIEIADVQGKKKTNSKIIDMNTINYITIILIPLKKFRVVLNVNFNFSELVSHLETVRRKKDSAASNGQAACKRETRELRYVG